MPEATYGEVHPPESFPGPATEGARLSLTAPDGTKSHSGAPTRDPNGSWRNAQLNGVCAVQVCCGGNWNWLVFDSFGHVCWCSSRFKFGWFCPADGGHYYANASNAGPGT